MQEVGGMTVAEAGERFSSLEIVEWAAFLKIQSEAMKRQSKGDTTDD